MTAIQPAPPELPAAPALQPEELEALIEEARRRTRRRRRGYAILIAAGLAAVGIYVGLASGGRPASRTRSSFGGVSGSPLSSAAAFGPMWFASVQMISPEVGWALRWTENPGIHDRALLGPARTTDGGRTWTNVMPAAARALLSPTQSSETSFALDTEHAWVAVSRNGGRRSRTIVFSTTNGGLAWSHGAAFDLLGSPESITFVDPRHGWLMSDLGEVMGYGAVAVYTTSDGGRDWSLVARTSSLPFPGSIPGRAVGGLPVSCYKVGIRFASPAVGWITGGCEDGPAFAEITRDGGRSWTAQALPIPKSACSTGCEALPPQLFGAIGFLAVTGGTRPFLLATHDGGATWSQATLPATGSTVSQIQFVNAHNGFLVAAAPGSRKHPGLYRTSDGGRTWRAVLSNQPPNGSGITFDFVDPTAGVAWIPGADATSRTPPLYRTTNGAGTWARLNPRVTQTRRAR